MIDSFNMSEIWGAITGQKRGAKQRGLAGSFIVRVPWKRMLEGEREFAEDSAWQIKNRDTIVSVG